MSETNDRQAGHTEGLLHYQEESDAYTHIIRDEQERYVAGFSQHSNGRAEADARRFVACWNYLLPLTTEEIESVPDPTLIYRERDALQQQRDELLGALKAVSDDMECYCLNPEESLGRNPCGHCKAKAAIKNAEAP
jgi:hypothetical protein